MAPFDRNPPGGATCTHPKRAQSKNGAMQCPAKLALAPAKLGTAMAKPALALAWLGTATAKPALATAKLALALASLGTVTV